jgi:hypothetical protein
MPQYHANPVNDAQRISNMSQLIKFLYTVGIEINGIQGSGMRISSKHHRFIKMRRLKGFENYFPCS